MPVVASESYVDEHDLWDRAIEIAGQSMVTDLSSTFADDTDCIKIVGYDMSKEAARQAYEEAEVSADEVDVEPHDCFSANELITYEALGPPRRARATSSSSPRPLPTGATARGQPLWRADLDIRSAPPGWPNARAHPQLRGQADARQVDGAEVALQHNIGLGGAAVVSIYKPAVA